MAKENHGKTPPRIHQFINLGWQISSLSHLISKHCVARQVYLHRLRLQLLHNLDTTDTFRLHSALAYVVSMTVGCFVLFSSQSIYESLRLRKLMTITCSMLKMLKMRFLAFWSFGQKATRCIFACEEMVDNMLAMCWPYHAIPLRFLDNNCLPILTHFEKVDRQCHRNLANLERSG